MSGFDGKVAIVTGGGSGLGESIGKALATRGVKVVLSDIKLEAAQRVAAEIKKKGGTASAFRQDTAKPKDSASVVRHAVRTCGALHYAVNNAGIGGAQAPAGETDLTDWQRVIEINLSGVLYGMRYQIPAMIESGARGCAIVNMASIHGMVAAVGNGAYTAAKHGVVGLTKNAAVEHPAGAAYQLCRAGVHPNAVPCKSPPQIQEGGRRSPSSGTPRPPGRGRSLGVLPVVRRRLVHHWRLLPGRWGLYGCVVLDAIGVRMSWPTVQALH